jgi:hypothetical protein
MTANVNTAKISDENALVLTDELHKSVEQHVEADGVHVEAQSYVELEIELTIVICFFFF